MYDLVIVGGGPVGLATGIAARQKGLSACVFERKDGPVDKACGEGIMPSGRALLEQLGVTIKSAYPFDGIRYLNAKNVEEFADGHFTGGGGFGVRRLELHRALTERAREAGVHIVNTHANEVVLADDSVSVNGVEGRYLIAADGLNSPLRRRFELEGAKPTRPRYGARQHFNTAPWSNKVEVYWSDHGEAYVTPVDEKTVGVAFLFYKPGAYADLLAQLPSLKDRLGRPASKLLGAGPFMRSAKKRVKGRLLLVGDAAGYVDPLTGEGISLGILSGVIAVNCIADGCPERYDRAWRRAMLKYQVLTHGLLTLTRAKWIRRHLVAILRLVPFLFDFSLSLLGGKKKALQEQRDPSIHSL